jgi:hypothetical protein
LLGQLGRDHHLLTGGGGLRVVVNRHGLDAASL